MRRHAPGKVALRVRDLDTGVREVAGRLDAYLFLAGLVLIVASGWHRLPFGLGGLGLWTSLATATGAAAVGGFAFALRRRRWLFWWERDQLLRWLMDERRRLGDLPPAGAGDTTITLRSYFGSGALFIEPLCSYSWGDERRPSLVAAIAEELDAGRPLMVLGDPGQGKTLVLQATFDHLAEAFVASNGKVGMLPLYIRLSDLLQELGSEERMADMEEHEILAAIATWIGRGHKSTRGRMLSPRRLQRWWASDRVAVFLDGLDELSSTSGGADPIGSLPAGVRGLLTGPSVLSSRTAFFEIYVRESETALDHRYLTLSGIDFRQHGEHFVRSYVAHFRMGQDVGSRVLATIDDVDGLLDLVTRPLTLFMVTDVLASGGMIETRRGIQGGSDGTPPVMLVEIYQLYVERWLRVESSRADAILDFESRYQLALEMAWDMFLFNFRGNSQTLADLTEVRIPRPNLDRLVERWLPGHWRSAGDVFADLTNRNLLIRIATQHGARNELYRFAHKSFFEYLVARYVYEHLLLGNGDDEPLDVLAMALPDEVINFLRQSLLWLAGSVGTGDGGPRPIEVQEAIRWSLWTALEGTPETSDAAIMTRQQAGNLLPAALVGASPEEFDRLRASWAAESDIFVKRGIAVGVALHLDDPTLLEDFVRTMWNEHDTSALSVHLGYNRIYYGDQVKGEGWWDDGKPRCGRLFKASWNHLRNPRYRHHWAMSAATIAALLEDPGRRAFLALDAESVRDLHDLGAGLDSSDVCREAGQRLCAALALAPLP